MIAVGRLIGLVLGFITLTHLVAAAPQYFYDDRGYRVEQPFGWEAKTVNNCIQLRGPTGQWIIIYPNFYPEPLTAESAQKRYLEVRKTVYGNVRWQGIEKGEKPFSFYRSLGTWGEGAKGGGAVSIFSWLPGTNFAVAYFGSAPNWNWAASSPEIARVMNTFEFAPRPQLGVGQLRFVTLLDPVENAFTVDVPYGWPTSLGLVRQSITKKWYTWQVASPDYSMRLFFGDGSIPDFVVPGPMTGLLGMSRIALPAVTAAIRPYMTADQFLHEYIPRRFGNRVSNPKYQPHLAFQQALQQKLANETSQVLAPVNYFMPGFLNSQPPTASVSQVWFDYKMANGAIWQGYAIASTIYRPGPGDAPTWEVGFVYGYVSAPHLSSFSLALVQKMAGSVKPNLAHMEREGAALYAQTMQNSWVMNRNADINAHNCSNILLGLADYQDPTNGKVWSVPWAYNPHDQTWIDPLNRIVRTDMNHDLSMFNFHRMKRVPRP